MLFGERPENIDSQLVGDIGLVPTFLLDAFDIIFTNDLVKTQGLFRVAGAAKRIGDLQSKLNDNPVLPKDYLYVHDICSIIKTFVRKQPEVLIGRELEKNLYQCSNPEEMAAAIRAGNPQTQSMLLYLIYKLARVAQHSDSNSMVPSNLAVIFAPNLFEEQPLGVSDVHSPVELRQQRNDLLTSMISQAYGIVFNLPDDDHEHQSMSVNTSKKRTRVRRLSLNLKDFFGNVGSKIKKRCSTSRNSSPIQSLKHRRSSIGQRQSATVDAADLSETAESEEIAVERIEQHLSRAAPQLPSTPLHSVAAPVMMKTPATSTVTPRFVDGALTAPRTDKRRQKVLGKQTPLPSKGFAAKIMHHLKKKTPTPEHHAKQPTAAFNFSEASTAFFSKTQHSATATSTDTADICSINASVSNASGPSSRGIRRRTEILTSADIDKAKKFRKPSDAESSFEMLDIAMAEPKSRKRSEAHIIENTRAQQLDENEKMPTVSSSATPVESNVPIDKPVTETSLGGSFVNQDDEFSNATAPEPEFEQALLDTVNDESILAGPVGNSISDSTWSLENFASIRYCQSSTMMRDKVSVSSITAKSDSGIRMMGHEGDERAATACEAIENFAKREITRSKRASIQNLEQAKQINRKIKMFENLAGIKEDK